MDIIEEKINKEVEKILKKEELTPEEIQILITIKNEIKFELESKEKIKKMMELM